MSHPIKGDTQKCDRCGVKFIWLVINRSGAYIVSKEELMKRQSLCLKPKDYFLCNSCHDKWDSFKPKVFNYATYTEALAKFLKNGIPFVFR